MGDSFWGKIKSTITYGLSYPFSIDAHRGALTSLYCATSPEIESQNIKDRYFVPIAKERPEDLIEVAKDMSLSEKLWTFTDELVTKALA